MVKVCRVGFVSNSSSVSYYVLWTDKPVDEVRQATLSCADASQLADEVAGLDPECLTVAVCCLHHRTSLPPSWYQEDIVSPGTQSASYPPRPSPSPYPPAPPPSYSPSSSALPPPPLPPPTPLPLSPQYQPLSSESSFPPTLYQYSPSPSSFPPPPSQYPPGFSQFPPVPSQYPQYSSSSPPYPYPPYPYPSPQLPYPPCPYPPSPYPLYPYAYPPSPYPPSPYPPPSFPGNFECEIFVCHDCMLSVQSWMDKIAGWVRRRTLAISKTTPEKKNCQATNKDASTSGDSNLPKPLDKVSLTQIFKWVVFREPGPPKSLVALCRATKAILRLSLVCRSWREAALDDQVWIDIVRNSPAKNFMPGWWTDPTVGCKPHLDRVETCRELTMRVWKIS
ncbi:hypothetical protein Pelo_14380 [Pelomyxa schiedti]|nr:hypothetical protein Pelo_14380 [Pelomyxa schiedti]